MPVRVGFAARVREKKANRLGMVRAMSARYFHASAGRSTVNSAKGYDDINDEWLWRDDRGLKWTHESVSSLSKRVRSCQSSCSRFFSDSTVFVVFVPMALLLLCEWALWPVRCMPLFITMQKDGPPVKVKCLD